MSVKQYRAFYSVQCRRTYSDTWNMSVIFMSVNFMFVNFMPQHFDGPSFSCPSFSAPPSAAINTQFAILRRTSCECSQMAKWSILVYLFFSYIWASWFFCTSLQIVSGVFYVCFLMPTSSVLPVSGYPMQWVYNTTHAQNNRSRDGQQN